MTDIVERLRKYTFPNCVEAADEIGRLRSALSEAQAYGEEVHRQLAATRTRAINQLDEIGRLREEKVAWQLGDARGLLELNAAEIERLRNRAEKLESILRNLRLDPEKLLTVRGDE